MTTRKLGVVTGGAGFIGSHMVDLLLDDGFRVHVIDNLVGGRLQNLGHRKRDPNLLIETRDINELAADDSLFHGADYVFHFAGIGDIVPSIDRPVDYLATNLLGTIKVLEAARRAGVRKFVYAASSSCWPVRGSATESVVGRHHPSPHPPNESFARHKLTSHASLSALIHELAR